MAVEHAPKAAFPALNPVVHRGDAVALGGVLIFGQDVD
jgi:hypothetical protein